jgi:hypothetical protein
MCDEPQVEWKRVKVAVQSLGGRITMDRKIRLSELMRSDMEGSLVTQLGLWQVREGKKETKRLWIHYYVQHIIILPPVLYSSRTGGT